MEQFRLIFGLGFVATQLGVAALMVVLFLKTRGEQASRFWAVACIGAVIATLVSGFLPLGKLPIWALYLSALLTVVGLWLVWRGFRSFRGVAAPWWGWGVPGGFLAGLAILVLVDGPQFARSVFFTAASCSLLVMIAFEAVASRESRARWLVLLAAVMNTVSYVARPTLILFGFDVSGRTSSLPGLISTYIVPLFDNFMLFAGLALLAIQRLLRQKDALATLDELTQLPNRRALVEAARRAERASCRSGLPFSLMIIDIDHFKVVNDTSGHSAGDSVLREVGRSLVAACRPSDTVSRYGGDEFVVLCPDLGSDQAGALAQRLVSAVRLVHGGAVTVSLGLAAFEKCEHGVSWETVFERADRALYSAKQNGRDRVALN